MKVFVPIYGSANKKVLIDTAPPAAQLGVNIYYNGALLNPQQIVNPVLNTNVKPTVAGSGSAQATTTTRVIEGVNQYHTDSRARAALTTYFA